jgi:uncharacterized membrane protein
LVVVLRAAKEINPLMNRLIEWNPAAFILFKVTFVGFLFVLIYRNIPMNMTNRQKWIALLMFGGAFLGMTIAVVMGLIASVLFIIQ